MGAKTDRIEGGKETKKEVAVGDMFEVFVIFLLFCFIPALM
jgi:hypothetical protein